MSSLLFIFAIFALKGYPIILDIATTSDWVEINLENVDFYYQGDTFLVGEGKEFRSGILGIQKKPFDSSLVQAQFKIFLNKKLPPLLEFTGRKGKLGKTVVRFFTVDKETLAQFVYEEEKKDFFLRRETIQKIPLTIYSLPPKKKIKPQVFAFYYPWYSDNWFSNGKPVVAHKPVLGFYSSRDREILKKHILMAKEAEIDGFLVSWWIRNSPIDENLRRLVPLCESLKLKFTIYLESATSLSDLIEDLKYIDSLYAKSPSFLKIDGLPVIFIFSRVIEQLSLSALRTVKSPFLFITYGYAPSNLEGFFGFHEYFPWELDLAKGGNRFRLASQIAQAKDKIYCAPVIPGYDDRAFRQPGSLIDRNNGKFYQKSWKVALKTNPDWILITSFNEWFEGTEIEPSREFGDFYLKLTAHYAKLFKKRKDAYRY